MMGLLEDPCFEMAPAPQQGPVGEGRQMPSEGTDCLYAWVDEPCSRLSLPAPQDKVYRCPELLNSLELHFVSRVELLPAGCVKS